MKLVFPVEQLQKSNRQAIKIETKMNLLTALQQRSSDILDASEFTITGTLGSGDLGWRSRLHVVGSLVVPSTRSLLPVDLPIDLEIDEQYVLEDPAPQDDEDDEAGSDDLLIVIENNQVDLLAAIEDHILLAIPTQIFTPEEAADDEMPTGQGWEVISEQTYAANAAEREEQPNPEFAKLKALLPDQDDDSQTK
ncbi:DUF177 domain-containing protein [Lapidilactobacillus wuchangensis]|uniref:DUF177 domain-containing protein n=1 Tax=Lapidilactobacillus wuchangensis TaxID=2486001 RepID=UPI000F7BABF6|nr:DUF177 domain-containing protein [Lapidilactobacillus wuchangensis]